MRSTLCRLFEDDIRKLDSARGDVPRTIFAHQIIAFGLAHKNNIFLEIIDDSKVNIGPGRPKKELPRSWAMC